MRTRSALCCVLLKFGDGSIYLYPLVDLIGNVESHIRHKNDPE